MSKRIYYIDVMKGLGILFVLLAHISTNELLNTWIHSFAMPLFFFISGITCYIADKKNFIIKKVKSLLVPYFIFSFLTFLYWAAIERGVRNDEHSVLGQLAGIFIAQGGPDNHVYNIVMWFLPCLFIIEVLFNIIRKKTSSNKLILVYLSILSILGIVINIFVDIRLPWSIDTALMSIMFYGIGYILCSRIINNSKLDSKKVMSSAIIVFLIMSIVISYINKGIDSNNGTYSNYFLYYIGAFSGIGLIYFMSKLIKLKSIMFLGCNSLILMCVHEPIKRIVIKIISIVSNLDMEFIRRNIIFIFVTAIVIIGVILPIIYIINRYLPFMIGKFNGKCTFSFTKKLLGISKNKTALK